MEMYMLLHRGRLILRCIYHIYMCKYYAALLFLA